MVGKGVKGSFLFVCLFCEMRELNLLLAIHSPLCGQRDPPGRWTISLFCLHLFMGPHCCQDKAHPLTWHEMILVQLSRAPSPLPLCCFSQLLLNLYHCSPFSFVCRSLPHLSWMSLPPDAFLEPITGLNASSLCLCSLCSVVQSPGLSWAAHPGPKQLETMP